MTHARTFRLVFAFFTLLILGMGCAPLGGAPAARKKWPFGTPVDLAKLSQIKIGETTRAEVEQILGQPLVGMRNELSQEVTLEYFSQPPAMERPRGEHVAESAETGAVAALGPAALLAEMVVDICWPKHFRWEQHIVALKFNADGKLTEINTMVASGTGVVTLLNGKSTVGEEIDLTKADQIQEGKSTAADVEQLLGPPDSVAKTLQEVTWGYESIQLQGGRSGAEQGQEATIKVTLDSQGKVLKLSKDAWRSHLVQQHMSNAPLVRDNLLKTQVGKTTRTEVEELLGRPRWETVMEREKLTETRLDYLWTSPEKGPRPGLFSRLSVILDQNGVVKEIE
jgi:outer membrane protein assembly factor BamE (lipoprotein component of BamABCDE complex)